MNFNFFDFNFFMEELEGGVVISGGEEEVYGVIFIFVNIDMMMNVWVDCLCYMDMELKNINGKFIIRDEFVVIEEGSVQMLGGNLGFMGVYDIQDVECFIYNFCFELDKFNFQEIFNIFNFFVFFVLIGKLVNGNFFSNFIMLGELGSDMMFVLELINVEGLFEMFNGSLNGFKLFNVIGNVLDILELK